MDFSKHLELLGHRVEDCVTGYKGVVTSIAFDLYGCIQAVINPGLDKDGKPMDSHWFDVGRLKILDPSPVMALPQFCFSNPEDKIAKASSDKGPAEKPPQLTI